MTQQLADSHGNQEQISHAGWIPQARFIVSKKTSSCPGTHASTPKTHNANMCCFSLHASISVLFGLAVLATFTRFLTRLVSRRRLYLDDLFVLFALVCLCAGTGLMIHSYKIVFVDEAAATTSTFVIVPSQLSSLFGSLTTIDALFCIVWTATFSIKASFLALFGQLIKRVARKLTIYYWCTVTLTFLAWAFFEYEDFIVCPYFRAEVRKWMGTFRACL